MESPRTIAIASNGTLGLKGTVSKHFGHCRSWVFVAVANDEILEVRTLANPFEHEHSCSSVAKFLAEQGAEVVLAGGLGRNAHGHLLSLGVEAVSGFTGEVEESLRAWMRGALPGQILCEHHGQREADRPGAKSQRRS